MKHNTFIKYQVERALTDMGYGTEGFNPIVQDLVRIVRQHGDGTFDGAVKALEAHGWKKDKRSFRE